MLVSPDFRGKFDGRRLIPFAELRLPRMLKFLLAFLMRFFLLNMFDYDIASGTSAMILSV